MIANPFSQFKNESGRISAVIGLMVGFSFGFSLVNRYFARYFWNRSFPIQALLLLSLTALIGLFVGFLTYRYIIPVLFSYAKKWRQMIFIAACIAGVVWAALPLVRNLAIEWIATPPPPVTRWHTMEILAAGHKNPESQGSKVQILLVEVRGEDGQLLTIHPIDENGWIKTNNGLISKESQPANLKYGFDAEVGRDNITILLSTGPENGLASVRLDNKKQLVDLFEPQNGETAILSNVAFSNADLAWVIILRLLEAFAFCFIF